LAAGNNRVEGLEYDSDTVRSLGVGCLSVALAPIAVLIGWWLNGWAAGGILAAVVVSLVFVVDNALRDDRIPDEARQSADRAAEFARQLRPAAKSADVCLVRIDADQYVYAVYCDVGGPRRERLGIAVSRSEPGKITVVPLRMASDLWLEWLRRRVERRRSRNPG
jgi:hypothetical protein